MKNAPPTIEIRRLTLGTMQSNCYIVMDTKSKLAVIIDPGDDAVYISEVLTGMEAHPMAILATHGHFDHIMAAAALQLIYDIPFYIHKDDVFLVRRMRETAQHFLGYTVEDPPPMHISNFDETSFSIGAIHLEVICTPGHTPGSVCFTLSSKSCLFTGDTIFAQGGVGRTDFSYSDNKAMRQSIENIFSYPDTTHIYPGHGEDTSVGDEKEIHTKGFDVCGVLQ